MGWCLPSIYGLFLFDWLFDIAFRCCLNFRLSWLFAYWVFVSSLPVFSLSEWVALDGCRLIFIANIWLSYLLCQCIAPRAFYRWECCLHRSLSGGSTWDEIAFTSIDYVCTWLCSFSLWYFLLTPHLFYCIFDFFRFILESLKMARNEAETYDGIKKKDRFNWVFGKKNFFSRPTTALAPYGLLLFSLIFNIYCNILKVTLKPSVNKPN